MSKEWPINSIRVLYVANILVAHEYRRKEKTSKAQKDEIRKNIENGKTPPIFVVKKNFEYMAICGFSVLEIAKELGKKRIPCVLKKFENQEIMKKYVSIMNKNFSLPEMSKSVLLDLLFPISRFPILYAETVKESEKHQKVYSSPVLKSQAIAAEYKQRTERERLKKEVRQTLGIKIAELNSLLIFKRTENERKK